MVKFCILLWQNVNTNIMYYCICMWPPK